MYSQVLCTGHTQNNHLIPMIKVLYTVSAHIANTVTVVLPVVKLASHCHYSYCCLSVVLLVMVTTPIAARHGHYSYCCQSWLLLLLLLLSGSASHGNYSYCCQAWSLLQLLLGMVTTPIAACQWFCQSWSILLFLLVSGDCQSRSLLIYSYQSVVIASHGHYSFVVLLVMKTAHICCLSVVLQVMGHYQFIYPATSVSR